MKKDPFENIYKEVCTVRETMYEVINAGSKKDIVDIHQIRIRDLIDVLQSISGQSIERIEQFLNNAGLI